MDRRAFPPVGFFGQRQAYSAPQSLQTVGQPLPRTDVPTAPMVDTASPLVGVFEPWRQGGLVSLQAALPTIAVGVSSLKFLDQTNAPRNLLGFRNASAGTQNLYIDFASEATAQSWLKLIPGQMILFDTVVPQDDLYAISDAAGGILAYVYSTINLGT